MKSRTLFAHISPGATRDEERTAKTASERKRGRGLTRLSKEECSSVQKLSQSRRTCFRTWPRRKGSGGGVEDGGAVKVMQIFYELVKERPDARKPNRSRAIPRGRDIVAAERGLREESGRSKRGTPQPVREETPRLRGAERNIGCSAETKTGGLACDAVNLLLSRHTLK